MCYLRRIMLEFFARFLNQKGHFFLIEQNQQQQQHIEQADLTIQPSVEEQNGHINGHVSMEEVAPVEAEQAAPVRVDAVEAPVVLEELPVENVNRSVQKEELQNQTTETKINSWAKLVQSSGASVLENTGMLTGNSSQVYSQSNQYLPSSSSQKREQAPNNTK